MTDQPVVLNGSALNIDSLNAIASGRQVIIDQESLERMQQSNALILQAARSGKPVYGVTTALGPQVQTVLDNQAINEFAIKTIRGRAHAVGPPLSRHLTRAAMTVRLNSLLTGASGASPAIASHLQACLNADLIPVVGETASVGAADLLWGATMGLALIGEGRFIEHEQDSCDVLAAAGIEPLVLGPRDGLALSSHSGFSSALAAIGQHRANVLWHNAQLATALTLEGFRGNLSPLNPDLLKARMQPGQNESAQDISQLLSGSGLYKPDAARRLQDPLSIRNIVQVHGTVHATLVLLAETIELEVNGASDNPIVLMETKEILSSGAYLNPHLGSLLVAVNHALVQMAAASVSRGARMMSNRFTDLQIGLHTGATGSVGLGAATKVTEALFAEIVQLASPPAVYPPTQADSVEDCISNTAISAKALLSLVDKLNVIVAFEMLAAVHAIYLRQTENVLAPALVPVAEAIRKLSPAITEDRSLTAELESLAAMLADNQFDFVRHNEAS